MNPIISPSVLSADFGNLAQDIGMLNESEAEWIHCDVMDGVFVPNISFGIPVIKKIASLTEKVVDVHLMIVQPERYISAFKDAGANVLTIHQEACVHLDRTLTAIREAGMMAGVSLNPGTPVSVLEDVLHLCDMVLIMSVNPGFGGQKFIPNALRKIRTLRSMIDNDGYKTLIQVDGGVSGTNAKELVEAGANVLVSGSFVFKSENPIGTIRDLKHLSY